MYNLVSGSFPFWVLCWYEVSTEPKQFPNCLKNVCFFFCFFFKHWLLSSWQREFIKLKCFLNLCCSCSRSSSVAVTEPYLFLQKSPRAEYSQISPGFYQSTLESHLLCQQILVPSERASPPRSIRPLTLPWGPQSAEESWGQGPEVGAGSAVPYPLWSDSSGLTAFHIVSLNKTKITESETLKKVKKSFLLSPLEGAIEHHVWFSGLK